MRNNTTTNYRGSSLYTKYIIAILIFACTTTIFAQSHKTSTSKVAPTITNHEAIRIEGTWFVLDYSISGTSIQGTGVCWGSSHNPDTTNDKTIRLSPSNTRYKDTCSTNMTTDGIYYARAYVYNADGITYGAEDTIYTQPKTEPAAKVTGITTTSIDSTSIGFTWTDNGSTAYVIKICPGTAEPSMSEFVDTTSPTPYFICASTLDPDDVRDVFQTNSGTKHSLQKDSTYTFKFIPLNDVSIFTLNDHNYRQDPNTYVTYKTVKGKPTTQASNISFSNITSNSFTISWTNGDGEKRVVYMNSSNSFTGPSDKTEPTPNSIWADAGEQCVYNGTGSQVTVSGIKDSVTYFVHVYEANNSNSSIYFKTSDYTDNPDSLIAPVSYWKGTTSSAWETNTNWSQSSLPISSQNIIITNTTNKPEISSNVTVNNITIKPNGVLTVNNNYTLTINNDLTIESSASGDGSLVVIRNGATSVSGTSKIQRYVGDGNWHYLSNPTGNTSINVLAGYYANLYSESDAAFKYLTGSSTLDKTIGYSIKNAHVGTNDTLTFTGAFNNGAQSTTVTNSNTSDDTYGWNLVGNPFPCAIDWEASSGWTRTDINATAYFYNGSGYVDWNYSSGTGSGSKIIPMGQGFFIFSTVASTTFGMDNDVRTSSSQSYYKKRESNNAIFQLQLENDSLSDRTSIVFMDEASENFEISDGHKLFSGATYIPELYTITNGYELSINSLNRKLLDSADNTYQIPIAFISQLETELTFSVTNYKNIPDSIKLVLIDKYMYDTIDIKNSNYTFSTDTGKFVDRFAIKIDKIKSTTGISTLNNKISTYITNDKLVIYQSNPQNNEQLVVSDVLGRVIINKSLTQENKHFIKLPINNNIFVINIYSKNKILLRKTVIRNN